MLSVRPWSPSAIVRLILCLVVCLVCGSLIMGLLRHPAMGPRLDLRFYRITASALGCAATAIIFIYRSWNPETVVSRLAGYLICLYAGIALGAWAQKTGQPQPGPSIGQMIVATLSFQGATLVFVPHFLKEQHLGWTEAFGFGTNRRQALMLGVILACIFLPLGIGLQWISAEAMIHIPHLKPQEQESVQTLQMAVTWVHRLALGFVTIVIAPPAEEMLFRGILYPAIKQAGFPRLAFWGTAVVFAAIHMNMVTFLPLMVLALVLTLLYERTGDLLAPITAHALFNAMNFVILYSTLGTPNEIK